MFNLLHFFLSVDVIDSLVSVGVKIKRTKQSYKTLHYLTRYIIKACYTTWANTLRQQRKQITTAYNTLRYII